MHRQHPLLLQLLAAALALASLAGCNATSSESASGTGDAGLGSQQLPPGFPPAPPGAPTAAAAAAVDQLQVLPGGIGPLPAVPVPSTNPMSPAKIALGRQLFFDTRLSGNGQLACATCHNPQRDFTDGLPRSQGSSGELDRNAPTVINAAYYQALFWDGRAASLEAQASGPILAVREMNGTQQQVETLIQTDQAYQRSFPAVFGTAGTFTQVTQAIAAYERTIVTGSSPFDRYAGGDKQALSANQKLGLGLFIGKASCLTCHNGPQFSDNLYHDLGVPAAGPLTSDPGRFTVTGNPADKGAFRTASLRNVAQTAPYMHDGSLATLPAVVAFYNAGGGSDPNKTSLLKPLHLTGTEQQWLVAFLQSLTDDEAAGTTQGPPPPQP